MAKKRQGSVVDDAAAGLVNVIYAVNEGQATGQTDHGVVTVASADLNHNTPGCGRPRRETYRRQQLVCLQRRVQEAGEEAVGWNLADSGCRLGDHGGPGGEGDRRHLGCRVGVGETADHRAPTADGSMPDLGHGLVDQGRPAGQIVGLFGPGVGYERPDRDRSVVVDVDPVEIGEAGDIQQLLGWTEPQGHDGEQALAPGQDLD